MELQLIITIVTAFFTLITAIILAFINYRNNKKFESIRTEIENKAKKDTEIFKYLLTYETETINQYLIALKDFLQCSQELKDKTKQLFNNFTIIDAEKKIKLDSLKEEIIKQYSKNIYYFNMSDKKHIAHSIKNLMVDLIDATFENSNEKFTKVFYEITEKQKDLQIEVNIEINKALNEIRKKVS